MEKKIELPVEAEEQIAQEAQSMLVFVPDNKWSYIQGATAYATKLHEERQQRIHLEKENDILTANCNELRQWKMNAAEELTLIGAYAHKHLEVNLGDSIPTLVMTHLNEARDLLTEVFRKHESGLLPDRFIYEKIKRFLYGE
jgi:DNA repair ATPase RecN